MLYTKDDVELTLKELKGQKLQCQLQLEALDGSIARFADIIDHFPEEEDVPES